MATFISNSPEATQSLGAAWGAVAQSGLVIALSGDLGAGKTQLVKGLARGLGIADPARSPTFALIHIYQGGRLPLYHLDLYRLGTPAQITAAGLDDYFQPDGVAVIEWAERWPGFSANSIVGPRMSEAAPGTENRWRRVVISTLPGESARRIDYEDIGL